MRVTSLLGPHAEVTLRTKTQLVHDRLPLSDYLSHLAMAHGAVPSLDFLELCEDFGVPAHVSLAQCALYDYVRLYRTEKPSGSSASTTPTSIARASTGIQLRLASIFAIYSAQRLTDSSPSVQTQAQASA